jgi:uracil-DNA glycosylase
MLKLERSWYEILKEEIKKPYVGELKKFLEDERARKQVVYPSEENIFNAFRYTPFSNVKVVIIGQDPYHGPGQAHGMSFSVPSGVGVPPSLRNIFLELEADLGIPPTKEGCLIPWAKQGVLLMNTTLTVRKHEPRSHAGRGWELFTDAVVAKLWARKDPIVFLLWGRFAQEKALNVFASSPATHLILSSAHPSPYSAARFFGCRHFSKANDFLVKNGKKEIQWALYQA